MQTKEITVAACGSSTVNLSLGITFPVRENNLSNQYSHSAAVVDRLKSSNLDSYY
jgi:hypothetical protein